MHACTHTHTHTHACVDNHNGTANTLVLNNLALSISAIILSMRAIFPKHFHQYYFRGLKTQELLSNTSFCAWGTLNPEKPKCQRLGQRKVYCSQARGAGGPYSRTRAPQWCSGKHFKGKIWSVAWRMDPFHSDLLMMKWQSSVPGILCSTWSYHPPPRWGISSYARPQR